MITKTEQKCRMSVLVDSLSMMDFGPKSMKSGCKPWIGFSSAIR